MRSTLLLIQNISNMNAVPQAVLIGDVTVAEDCYVGAGAVLRGDNLFRYRHRSRKPHPGPYRDTGRECRHGFAREGRETDHPGTSRTDHEWASSLRRTQEEIPEILPPDRLTPVNGCHQSPQKKFQAIAYSTARAVGFVGGP